MSRSKKSTAKKKLNHGSITHNIRDEKYLIKNIVRPDKTILNYFSLIVPSNKFTTDSTVDEIKKKITKSKKDKTFVPNNYFISEVDTPKYIVMCLLCKNIGTKHDLYIQGLK